MSASALANMAAAIYAEKMQRERISGMFDLHYGVPAKPAPCKCPGCGSHEFRANGSRTVCAYCRTPAS